MKTLTVRLPDTMIAEIEEESRTRHVSKSDIVRGRLGEARRSMNGESMRELIGDLVGSVGGLPAKLSAGKKRYLAEIIRAQNVHRR